MSAEDKQQPNLRWSRLATSEPPPSYREVRETIELPDAATVKKGFYHKDAARLKRLSGGDLIDFDYKEQLDTDLPEDFPMREVLRGLGVSFAQIKELSDGEILELDGIGVKSVPKIVEYLKGLDGGNE